MSIFSEIFRRMQEASLMMRDVTFPSRIFKDRDYKEKVKQIPLIAFQ